MHFASVDFEKVSLKDGLAAAGFDLHPISFFSWLGVTMYLSVEAIDDTLRFVLSMPRLSEIVFTFVVPDDLMPPEEVDVNARVAARAAEIGEPWLTRFRPLELKAKLTAMGFSSVIYFSPDDARRLYFNGRSDGLLPWSTAQMMRAIV